MRLDRHDILPLAIILVFAFGLPLATFFAFPDYGATRDFFRNAGKASAVILSALAVVIAALVLYARRREQRMLRDRGEQTAPQFADLFSSDTEKRAASLLFEKLTSLTATGRVPKLHRDTQIDAAPLFLAADDLRDEIRQLCSELNVCTALDPDNESLLYSSTTVSQIVSALAAYMDAQADQLTPMRR